MASDRVSRVSLFLHRVGACFLWLGLAGSVALSPVRAAEPVAASAAVGTLPAPPDSTLINTLRRSLNESRWAAAESLALVLRARAEARTPLDSLLLARALDQLVAARLGAGRVNDAELPKVARRALALRERVLGPEHGDLAVSLVRLAELLNAQGDCAAAIPLAERGVRIREKLLGPEAIAVARGMTILGMGLYQCGRLEEARQVYERSAAIREKVLGPNASEVAVSLNNLGSTLQSLGRLEEAQATLVRALEIRRKTLGPDHPYIATTLGNLANLCVLRGQYAEARRLQLEALAIREKAAGPRSAEAALSYFNLGVLGLITGNYDESIAWNEKALDAREFALGPEHPDVALALDNYGGILVRIGDYAGAIRLLERAIALHRRNSGADPAQLAWALTNMALARSGAGQHVEAVRLAGEGRNLVARNRAFAPLDRAQFEEALAYVLMQKGDLVSARRYWQRALALREGALAADHPEIARVCAELADVERRLGHMASADRLLRRAMLIYGKTSRDLPGWSDAGQKQSMLLYQRGDAPGALAALLVAQRADREKMRAIARTLPERQALRFAATHASGRDLLLTLAVADSHAATPGVSWNDVMAARSLVLDELAGRLRLSQLMGGAVVDSLRGELVDAGAWLAHLMTTDEPPTHPERASAELEAARARYDAAERALALASLDFRRQAERPAPTLEALRAARPPHGAIVAFARYAQAPRRAGAPEPGPAHYLAFVLPADQPTPRVVPLGAAARIDSLVATWRAELATGALRRNRSPQAAALASEQAGHAVRRAVWDPLRSALGPAERVFLVPEGPLHLVNFAALPEDDGRYLVEGAAVLHVVTTERDLLTAPGEASGHGLLAVGGAAFDSLGMSAPEANQRPAASAGAPAVDAGRVEPTPATFRGARNGCPRFQDLRFVPLAGSLNEIAALAQGWTAAAPGRAGEPATVVSGRRATEELVKRAAPGHRVLHLATHGFYLDAEFRDGEVAAPGGRGIGGLVSSKTPRRGAHAAAPAAPPLDLNPFHLSGVALAGANLRAEAGTERDDGILTAEELAVMNLDGVEWAVLSACDSGVGAVGEGEGVFGLRRALQIAGARTVILALWSVRDELTAPWMDALYAAHFARGLDTATACRDASRAILAARRAAGQSTHPFYWAGFLAAGDWR